MDNNYAKNITKYKEIFQRRVKKRMLPKAPLNDCNKDIKHTKMVVNISKRNVHTKNNNSDNKETRNHDPPNPFRLPKCDLIYDSKDVKRKNKKIPFIMSEPRTICDIDENFFKIIEGRPLRQSVDRKVYMTDIRNITQIRAMTGYKRDEMVQIDNSHADEIEEYNKVNKLFTKTTKNFAKFTRECYMIAQEVQNKAAAKAKQLQDAIELLDSYSFAFVKLRNEIGNVEVTLQILNTYRSILYNIAPLAWRELYDEEFAGRSYYFDRFESQSSDLTLYKQSMALFTKEKQPRLYFKRPNQLMDVFESLSRQCLNYMQIDVQTSAISRKIYESREFLKSLTAQQEEELEEFIDIIKRELKRVEEEEETFKSVFENLLMKEFYELYASYESSKLFTCLQFVNTQVFGYPEDPKDNIVVLAQQLERLYIELNAGLDTLNIEVVKAATTEYFAADLKAMKSALFAKRQLNEWKILKNKLIDSFEPPRNKKVTVRRSV